MKHKYIVMAVSLVMAAVFVNPGTLGVVYADTVEPQSIETEEVFEESPETPEAQTDPYGNIIDWDTSGNSDEDTAGLETEVDLMDSPTYSPEERESVAAIIGIKPAKNEETGFVRVTCDLGDDWADYNVRVVVYDKDFDQYLIYEILFTIFIKILILENKLGIIELGVSQNEAD